MDFRKIINGGPKNVFTLQCKIHLLNSGPHCGVLQTDHGVPSRLPFSLNRAGTKGTVYHADMLAPHHAVPTAPHPMGTAHTTVHLENCRDKK